MPSAAQPTDQRTARATAYAAAPVPHPKPLPPATILRSSARSAEAAVRAQEAIEGAEREPAAIERLVG
jgi:hypothetical protein